MEIIRIGQQITTDDGFIQVIGRQDEGHVIVNVYEEEGSCYPSLAQANVCWTLEELAAQMKAYDGKDHVIRLG